MMLREGWLSFALLALMQLTMVGAMRAAAWVEGLGILAWISLVSLVWGLALAKLRLPAIVLHLIGLPVGVAQVVYFMTTVLPEGDLSYRVMVLWDRLNDWIRVTSSGGIGTDNLLFLLFVSSVTWLIGYFSVWTVFREHNGWWASIATGIALIINLSYATRLDYYFFAFLLFAFLLIIRLNVYGREQVWLMSRVTFDHRLRGITMRGGFAVAAFAVAVAWAAPGTLLASQQISAAFSAVNGPWDDLQSEFSRLFGGIGSGSQRNISGFGKTLPLKSVVTLGDDIVLYVSGTEPRRLRGVVYEKYTGKGWLAAERPEYQIQPFSEQSDITTDYQLREEITQTIQVAQPRGMIVFAAGQPQRFGMPVAAQIEMPAPTKVDVTDLESGGVPDEVRGLAQAIQARASEQNLSLGDASHEIQVTPSAASRLILNPYGKLEVTGVWMRGNRVSALGIRQLDGDYADVSVLRSPGMLRRGFQYVVVSSVSVADEVSLRKANGDYPEWVRQRYLPLPRTVTARTVRLARQLTFRYDNAFDKAVALERHLRTLGYSDNVDVPSSANDSVDYFLFVGREGYCDYFASAFVVMSRALGIPARVVSGYAPGDVDLEKGITVVRDWHAHSWPEVYIPPYGWIEFEPTPSRPPIERSQTPESEPKEEQTPLVLQDEQTEGDDALVPGNSSASFGGEEPTTEYGGIPAMVLLAVFALVAVLLLVYLSVQFAWHRGLRGLPRGKETYAKMYRLAYLLGAGPKPNYTPNEFADALASAMPEERSNIGFITRVYIQQQFGRKQPSEDEEQLLIAAWRQVRNRLIRRLLKLR